MKLLASNFVHVVPPSSERYSPRPFSASMLVYTTCGFDSATCTATRPHGFGGNPLALLSVTSLQCKPPSVDLNNPLPGPPERNVHPCRRKSHIAAYMVFGSCVLRAIMAQPVEPFAPARTFVQVLPPSVVR